MVTMIQHIKTNQPGTAGTEKNEKIYMVNIHFPIIMRFYDNLTYLCFQETGLTHPMLGLLLPKHNDPKSFENHLNAVMLALIE